jgi:RsiW-degrading membrane proteinase PrsW (M82 family)
MANPISPPPGNPQRHVGRSTFFPLLSNPSQLWSKGYLLPAAAVIALVMYIFLVSGNIFWQIGAITYLITGAGCIVIYRLCGRRHLWWPMIGMFAVGMLLFMSPPWQIIYPLFELINPAAGLRGSPIFAARFAAFLSVGFREEIFKALPVLLLAGYTWYARRGLNAAGSLPFGVNEPLDGILLCVAAGAGFAIPESLDQYLFAPILKMCSADALPIECTRAIAQGFKEGFFRAFGSISAHIAWSGYFGFFIGMAVLRPKAAAVLLLAGLIPPAILHAAYDAAVSGKASSPIAIPVAMLGYALLVAAILKARQVSPTRSQNFATVVTAPQPLTGPRSPQPQQQVSAWPAAMGKSPPAATALVLKIGPVTRTLAAGMPIEPILLGKAGAGRGKAPIAEIAANPSEPGVLGLRNLSDRVYRAKLPTGKMTNVSNGQTVRLSPGVVIDFGGIEGIVQAK